MKYPSDRCLEVSPGITVCRTFSEEVKTDLWSTAVRIGSSWWIFDPIAPCAGLSPVAGIVQTNSNHRRACATHNVPPVSRGSLDSLPSAFTTLEIDGGAPDEIAVLVQLPQANLCVVGDALIHMPPKYPLMFLPDQYCENPEVLRRSICQLLDWKIDILCFAHGEPLLSDVQAQLQQLCR